MIRTRFTEVFGITHPIIMGGMRATAMAELVAAVANADCLAFLSAHTHVAAEDLRREIIKTRSLTDKPFGVNLTVLPNIGGRDYDAMAKVIVEEGIRFVETTGSNPAKYIELFKSHGIKIIHKCPSSIKFAVKGQQLGADAISVHGFECGGHPGDADLPALVLIPAVTAEVDIPVLSSGGVADGRGLAAVLALGAEGAVMGTRFLLTRESPLHPAVKQRMLEANERDTILVGRSIKDTSRVLRNAMTEDVVARERTHELGHDELLAMIGADRWVAASRRGDPDDGAYPVGLAVGLIKELLTAREVVERTIAEASAIMTRRMPGLVIEPGA